MGVHRTEPIVWESHDIKFTVDSPDFEPVITILVDHTDEKAAIAQRASKSLLDAHDFVPVNEAGFQWMASAIRLAWSEARVAELEDWKETAITNSDCPDGHDPIDHFSTLAARAQKPRPMSEAPRDGTRQALLCRVTGWWSEKLGMWWTEQPSSLHPELYLEPEESGGSEK